ncbi:FAD-binding oxidoreductase [Geminocystis sp.]|uniref:FAD-binding oxidoreductase n=1 Tax=Geminocystis sp. TaxID=2664100 RepID=UPI0035936D00
MISLLPEDTRKKLAIADKMWYNLRHDNQPIKTVINTNKEILKDVHFDVIICGGTLGIFLATTLQKKGYKIGVIEKSILQGREQEWNISRHELNCLLELELLTPNELEMIIFTEYNPARISFHQGYELWIKDVLNVGVSPKLLISIIQEKFLQLGGIILENTAFNNAMVSENGVIVNTDKQPLKTRLLIDSMGHFSPIIKQVRKGEKPEGVCLVVGSCGKGFSDNETGDLIASFTPIQNQCQYFWEAFPAKDGRTTYLFTYVDSHPDRISLTELMTEYLRLLPEYQQIDLEAIDFKRFLFGFFPAYSQSPIKIKWDRILTVGDSSGSQSPVSFGGFGAMMRHLSRLTNAIDEALSGNNLSASDLALIQPYQPNISVTWLFQKTMSVGVDIQANPNQINDLMSGVFQVMDKLGDDVLKPFLQDVVQFSGLTKTLPLVNPKLVLPLLPQVGLPIFLDWLKHYTNLGIYSSLYPVGKSLQPLTKNLTSQQKYYYHRWLDMLQYGAGFK